MDDNKLVTTPAGVPNTAEFYKQREPVFNASMAAVLFGEHPFESAADYWIRKVNKTEVDETDQMRRGSCLEPALANYYELTSTEKIVPADLFYVRGRIGCSLDYITPEHDRIIEIKTTSKQDVEDPLAYWVWQVQAQMLVTGLPVATIVWMDGRQNIRWADIERDLGASEEIWKQAHRFMEGVDSQVMPEWIETEARHIIEMFPNAAADALEVGDRAFDLVDEYWSHKQAAKYHDEEASRVRDVLFNLAGDHSELTSNGKTMVTLRPRKLPAQLDKKRLQKDHPNLYLEYMSEPSTTRVVNVPKAVKTTIENQER